MYDKIIAHTVYNKLIYMYALAVVFAQLENIAFRK